MSSRPEYEFLHKKLIPQCYDRYFPYFCERQMRMCLLTVVDTLIMERCNPDKFKDMKYEPKQLFKPY